MSNNNDFCQSENLCLTVDKLEDNLFNRERTLSLINLFKKYKAKVGFDIKNKKRMWEVISREISNIFKITILPTKCENKWKVLERNYKKFVDNNRTGRRAKFFEFEKELKEIYGKKLSIHPCILLSSNTVVNSSKVSEPEKKVVIEIEDVESKNTASSTSKPKENSTKRKLSERSVTPTYKNRNEILLEMKNDLKQYYTEKNAREEQKLELTKRKLEDRVKRTKILEDLLTYKQKRDSIALL